MAIRPWPRNQGESTLPRRHGAVRRRRAVHQPRAEDRPMRYILAGTDGSITGQVAVRWAAELAVETKARFLSRAPGNHRMRRCARTPTRSFATKPSVVSTKTGARPHAKIGVDYEPLLLEGDPRTALLTTAESRDADLVVVGARGTGSHPHALHLGSVTHHLIHHIERPLVAIPASARSLRPARIVVGVDGSSGSARAVEWCVGVATALNATVLAVFAQLPLAEWVPHTDPRQLVSARAQALQGMGRTPERRPRPHPRPRGRTRTGYRAHRNGDPRTCGAHRRRHARPRGLHGSAPRQHRPESPAPQRAARGARALSERASCAWPAAASREETRPRGACATTTRLVALHAPGDHNLHPKPAA